MAKGMVRSSRRGRPGQKDLRKALVKFVALPLSVVDGAPGWGTVILGGLPQGNFLLMGAVAYVQLTTTSANIIATFNGSYSVGTSPTADGTLNGAEVNIIPSTVLGAATAKVSPRARGASTANGVILDNTDGSMELNLNVIIDDASISGAAAFTVAGEMHIVYTMLGDD